jgi:hypothetical protein
LEPVAGEKIPFGNFTATDFLEAGCVLFLEGAG